jgi:hypothetical protein
MEFEIAERLVDSQESFACQHRLFTVSAVEDVIFLPFFVK